MTILATVTSKKIDIGVVTGVIELVVEGDATEIVVLDKAVEGKNKAVMSSDTNGRSDLNRYNLLKVGARVHIIKMEESVDAFKVLEVAPEDVVHTIAYSIRDRGKVDPARDKALWEASFMDPGGE